MKVLVFKSKHIMAKQRLLIALILAVFSFLELSAQKQVIYYVPLPDNDFHGALKTVNNNTASNDLNSVVSITTSQNGAIVTYDHWEDGYEVDINHPVQSTTQIWGDGNTGNGNASTILGCNCAGDILTPGDVITLKTVNIIPRTAGVVAYDGRDKIASNRKLSISRAGWSTTPGTVLAGAVEVLDTSAYDVFFQLPIGTNIANAIDRDMFQRTEMQVIAARNSTTVDIDKDANGTVDQTFVLNEGESMRVTGTINLGATVTSDKPVSVIAHGSDPTATTQNRWFQVIATNLWEQNYYSPVSSNSSASPSASFIFNGSASGISVDYTTRTTTGTLAVAANSVVRHDLPLGEGAKYTSLSNFLAIGANDVDATNRTNWDWGFTLLPESYLTQSASVGWGPGSSDLSGNGSPLWAIALYNTTIYADYDGDPATGSITDPIGNKCDSSISVNAYQVVRFFDYTDKNQSGMRVYTTDGTQVVVAWGEDGAVAATGAPFLDMGTIATPTKNIEVKKTALLHFDADSDTKADAGDTIKYKLILNSYSLRSDEIVQINDTLSSSLQYIPNSSVRKSSDVLLNGAIADAGTTPFPFDEAGLLLPSLYGHQFDTLEFLVKVLPLSQTSIFNSVTILFEEGDTYTASSSTNADTKPTATFDTVSLNEDDPATTVFVCSNDDFNADGPATAAITITTSPLHGIASVDNNGTPTNPTDDRIIYTPTANYNGVDTLIYRICDSNGDCDTAYVAINIASVDDAPVAVRDDVSTNEDVAILIPVVTSNDNFGGDGPDANILGLTQLPLLGTVSIDENGTPSNPIDDKILFTPNANVSGLDSLIYEICDIDGDCDTAVVYITINAVDDLPVANTEGVVVLEDASATTINVTSNDDFGGDGASVSAITITQAPANGIASVNDNGTPTNPTDDKLIYTPTLNFNGLDSIIYRIQDIDGDFDTAIVHITVQSVNDLPLANVDGLTIVQNAAATTVNVISNDNFGGDGSNNVAITITTAPTHGTASVNENGTPTNPTDDKIVFTPTSGFSGIDSLIYRIEDANGDFDTAIVHIRITPLLDTDGDGIVDIIDIDDDNDGVLDSVEGGQICASSVNVSLNTVPYAFNSQFNTSTTETPINVNNLLFGSLNFTGSLTGAATWQTNGGSAPNNSGGVQIKNNSVPTVGHYVYAQPINTNTSSLTGANTNNYALYEMNFPTPIENLYFISAGLNNGDTYEIYAFNGVTAIPLDAANLSGFSPSGVGDWTVYDLGDAMKVVGNNTGGGTNVDTNIFTTSVTGPITKIQIRSYKNSTAATSSTGTVTTAMTSFQYCTVAPFLDTDNDGVVNSLDRDSDADGCSDALEAGATTNTTANFAFTGAVGANGLIDTKETVVDNHVINYVSTYNDAKNNAVKACAVPIADTEGVVLNEDAGATTFNVTANDNFGINGGSTTPITITQAPVNGIASVDNNGTPTNPTDDKIIYTPTANFNGLDSLIYRIEDGNGDFDTAIVHITVLPVNDLPLANVDGLVILQDAPATMVSVTSNDNFGGDGCNNVAITITTAPTHGIASVDDNGTPTNPTDDKIIFTPTAGFNGIDSLIYRIEDSNGDFDTAIVHIKINATNSLPVANTEGVVLLEDASATTINVTTNDNFGGDGASASAITITKAPVNGIASVDNNGTPTNPTDDKLIYTPTSNFNGIDSIIYRIEDGNGDFDTAIVHITVQSVDDLPVANRDDISTNENATVNIPVVTSNDDFGGDGASTSAITITQAATKGLASVDNNGTPNNPMDDKIIFVPSTNVFGLDSLIYRICDFDGDCDTAIVYVNIIEVNDPIVANRDNLVTNEDATLGINILGNDTDTEGVDATSVTITEPAKHGTTSIHPTTGVITYTPNLNYNGKDTLVYRVCDNGTTPTCDTALVVVTIVPINDKPVANREDVSTVKNTLIKITVLANDTDVENNIDLASVFVTETPANGNFTENPDGTISYLPDPGFVGKDTLIYEICDLGSPVLCDTALVVITVNNVNDVPVANRNDATLNEDTPIQIAVVGNDNFGGDGASNTAITITKAPTKGTATVNNNGTPTNPADDKINYIPALNENGMDTLIYQICDSNGDCDTALVVYTITPINDVPTANREDVATLINTAIPIGVLSNDSDVDGTIDATSVTIDAAPKNGTTSVHPTTGVITYTPNTGFTGLDTLIYRVCDTGTPMPAQCDTALVVIKVNAAPNNAPVANREDVSVIEDGSLTMGVLANDTDTEGGIVPSTVTVTKAPAHGTATANPDGTITYTPTANYAGPDTLIYRVCDNGTPALCDTALVVITVNPSNDAPTANGETVATLMNTAIPISVVDNDTDTDGAIDATTVTIDTAPKNGTTSVNPTTGVLTYTPNTGFIGLDTLIYRVCDTGTPMPAQCDTAIVIINVTATPNNAPVANRDNIPVTEDTPLTFNVLSNDTDTEGGIVPATVTVTKAPLHGTATPNPDGTISYTPTANYAGVDTLIYRVCDNGTPALCDTALVILTISPINDKPLANRDDVATLINTAIPIGVLSNDSDVDGTIDATSVTIDAAPKNGTTSVHPTTGVITYTPNTGFTGLDTLIYRVCDTGTPMPAQCDTALVVINVSATPNNAPVANRDDVSTVQNSAIPIGVLDNDTDIDGNINPASVTVTTQPKNGTTSVNPLNGAITYTPNTGFAGKDTLIYRVCDSGTPALCDTALVVITVNAVNTLPLANRDDMSTNEDAAISFNVTGNDNFGGDGPSNSAITITKLPSKGMATVNNNGTPTNPADDKIDFVPALNANGLDTLIYQICDSNGDCDTALLVINIVPVNDKPVANGDAVSTPKNTAINVIVMTNDSDVENGLVANSVFVTELPNNGSIVDNPDGTITYTPNTGFIGVDTLVYEICDNGSPVLCDTAFVIINVTGTPNNAPVANREDVSVIEDGTLTIGVLANDTDTEGGIVPSTVTVTKAPAHGTATPNPDGTITYTPTANYAGKDTLIYRVCDNGTPALCDTALVVITVNPSNDAPTANGETVATLMNTAIPIGVINNDTDTDGAIDATTVTIDAAPKNGTTSIHPTTGVLTYTPNTGFTGLDTLIYRVCDTGTPMPAQCDTAIVIINVTTVANNAPVANRDNILVTEDTPLTFNVLSNDTDTEGGIVPATVTVTKAPAHGTATPNPDGTISYIPTPNYTGVDTLIYQVCDNAIPALCDTALVILTISPVNDKPLANRDDVATAINTALPINVLSNDSDADGGIDATTVTINAAPKNGTTSVHPTTGVITYTPNTGFTGKDTLIYRVCDTGTPLPAQCDTALVVITVTSTPNTAPIANRDDVSTVSNSALPIGVLGNDTDADGNINPASVTVTKQPKNGTTIVNPLNGAITYTPTTGFAGKDTLIYQVCDSGTPALCDTALVVITVNGVNTLPIANRDNATTNEDVLVSINVVASNDNFGGDGASNTAITITKLPSKGTATVNNNGTPTNPADDKIDYLPAANVNGVDTLIYQICDSNGDCDTALVVINITPINDAPIANRNDVLTAKNTMVTANVLANDTDIDGAIDPASLAVIENPKSGTYIINPDKTISYTPNNNFTGTDTLVYRVCDTGTPMPAQCDTALVVFTVTGTNDAPLANTDIASVDEDTPLIISVLVNDTDTEGVNPTTVTVTTPPKNGTAIPNANGTITYTPNPNFAGTDTLIYQVCDLGTPTLCDTAKVIITVKPINDPIVANRNDATTVKNTLITFNILTNDIDVDGGIDTASLTLFTAPNNGSAVFNPDGTLTYTPNTDFVGKDTLVYRVCDKGTPTPLTCDTAMVVITVNGVNGTPVATRDDIATQQDVNVRINVTANDNFGTDGPSTTAITIIKTPKNGTANVVTNFSPNDPSDDLIDYTPNMGYVGNDTLIYQICDSNGDCDTALVVITINSNVNTAPIANRDDVSTIKNEVVVINILGNDRDNSALDTASITITEPTRHGTALINTDGTITYTPNQNYIGNDTLIYRVCDKATPALCDTAIVVITVKAQNLPPIAQNDTTTTEGGVAVSGTVATNDSDVDDTKDNLYFTLLGTVKNTEGVLVFNPNGSYTFTPAKGYKDTLRVKYSVCDPVGNCDTATLVIIVTEAICRDIIAAKTIIANNICNVGDICLSLPIADTLNYTILLNNSVYQGEFKACANGGTAITVGVGNYQLIIGSNRIVCADTAQIVATCNPIISDTVTVVLQLGKVDTVCMNTTNLTGTNYTINLACAGSDSATYELLPGTACVELQTIKLGLDTICFKICDENNKCDTTFVIIDGRIDIKDVADDSITSTINTPVLIDVVSNDNAANGAGSVGVSILTPPNHGKATVEPDGRVKYTPEQDYCSSTPDSMTYVLCTNKGCDTAKIRVTILCDDIIIYNGFSPNGDGINDFFTIEGLEKYPDHNLCVFNRWGNKVLDVKDYKNDWNGSWSNQTLPDGTYYYVLTKGDGKVVYGYVQIHR
jgi:large repetitive protein